MVHTGKNYDINTFPPEIRTREKWIASEASEKVLSFLEYGVVVTHKQTKDPETMCLTIL